MTGQGFTSAAYYSLFSDDRARIEREAPLLERLYREAPGNRVADIACGTGLHAAFFAGIGADVDASDLSPDMIEQAERHHPHERITYRTGDMTAVTGGPYDLVICLGNSLSLLRDDIQLAQTFNSVARCLAPGGMFLSQTLNYNRPASRESRQRIETGTIDNTEVVGIKTLVPHGDRTLLAITWFAMTGSSPIAHTNTAVLRHLTPDHLVRAADSSGLKLAHLYGTYDASRYDPSHSPDVIAVFRQP